MRKRSRLLLPLLLVAMFVAACAPEPQIRDMRFLRDTSIIEVEGDCVAPCWRGIIPGETTWDDAFAIVSAESDFGSFQRNTDRETGERVALFSYRDGPECCRLASTDGEVITSILLLTTPRIDLEEVQALYGDPQYIRGEDVSETQTFVALVYPDVPMVVYAFAEGISTDDIDENSDIIGYVYLTTDEMVATLATAENLYSWAGYGALSEIFAADPVAFELDEQ